MSLRDGIRAVDAAFAELRRSRRERAEAQLRAEEAEIVPFVGPPAPLFLGLTWSEPFKNVCGCGRMNLGTTCTCDNDRWQMSSGGVHIRVGQ